MRSGSIFLTGISRLRRSIQPIIRLFERGRTDQALRESEERFHKAFNSNPGPITISEIETGRFINVNEKWLEMLGHTREETLGRTSIELGIWADPEHRRTMIRELLASGSFHEAPTEFITKNGPRVWALWSAEIIRLGGQDVMLSLLYDITQRRRTEQELRRSEKEHRELLENIPEAFIAKFDRDGRYTFVSSSIEMLTGKPADHFIGKRHRETVWREDIIHKAEAALRRVFTSGENDGFQYSIELPDGIRHRNVRAYPGSNEGGIVETVTFFSYDITELVQIEQALRRSEESLKEAQRIAQIGSWELDLRSNELTWSDEVYRIFGLEPQEFEATYEAFLQAVHPDDRALVDAAYTSSLQEERDVYEVEHRIKRYSTGEIRHVHEKCKHLRDERGTVIRSIGMVHDITERKQAQEALARSEQKFRGVFEQAAVGIAQSTLEGRIVLANERFCQIVGYPMQEIMDLSVWDLTLPEDAEAETAQVADFMAGNVETYVIQKRYIRRDGSFVWVEVNVSPLRDEHGGIRGGIAVVQEITARKVLERSLKESEEKFRKLFETSGSLLTISTLEDGRLVDVNDAFIRKFGFSREEVIGKTTLELGIWASPEDRGRVMQRLFSQGRIENEEITGMTKAGELKTFLFSAALMTIAGEEYFVASGRDITDRKQTEEALRKLTEELEERIEERTLELEKANKAKNEFLANMSHEIRTPLSGVFGMTEVILDQDPPEGIRTDLEIVRDSAGSVLSLLNDLLDLSRIEQEKLELHLREVDLMKMLTTLVKPYEIQAAEQGLSFELIIDPNIPEWVRCDPDRLGQILKNLLSNAIKFTEKGFIQLAVRPEKQDMHSVRLRFAVTDTGVGIPEEQIGTIFQSFTQLDPTYTKRFAGAGLGLAISKRLVELMGGRIFVQSEEGKGTTFTFAVAFENAEKSKEEAGQRISLSSLPSLTILLAEDNIVNRLFMRRALTGAGHKVQEAVNGIQVLEKLRKQAFDLILMDIQMPELDGMEATQQIRSGAFGAQDIPIIALTAYAMKGDRERFITGGFDGYVTKPVDFNTLAQNIAEVCGLKLEEVEP